MPLGTRILVATLVLLFGAAVLYYGFVMAPAERAPLTEVGFEDADAVDGADAENAQRPGDRLVDPIAAAGMQVPGAGRSAPGDVRSSSSPNNPQATSETPEPRNRTALSAGPGSPARSSDAAADRSQAALSARPLGIADPITLPGRLSPPGSSADPSATGSTETVRSDAGTSPQGETNGASRPGSLSARDQDARDSEAAPSPFTPATEPSGSNTAEQRSPGGSSTVRAQDPVRSSAPVTEAPKANEPLRVRERGAGGEPVPGLGREILHEVAEGETFSSIAQRHYGSANRWDVIARANPNVDPERLQIGQQLRIPPAAVAADARATSSSAGRAATPPATPPRSGDTYVVRAGDTLSSISSQFYGTPNHWSRLHQANRGVIGADPDRLRVGMTLHIPR